MIRHRSMAAFGNSKAKFPVNRYQYSMPRPVETSRQFRMVVRLAVACHDAGVDYDVNWNTVNGTVTITCQGESIPAAKPLPKEKRTKVIADWKPKQWEGEYQTECYMNSELKRLTPGMVIAHSSGLSLVMPCDTGEWGSEHGDADPNGKWYVTHSASGCGIGLNLSINKASEALTFMASYDVDWHLSIKELKTEIGQRALYTTIAKFG